MKKNLYKGAQSVFYEENESMFHFTKTMLENNIAIEEFTRLEGDEEDDHLVSHTWINVLHQNTLADMIVDSKIYTVYSGEYLAPIQVYRIIKDVFEVWNENSPQDFIEFIDNISVAWQSSSMQSKLDVSDDIMYAIKDRFNYLNSFAGKEENE